jgi:hypothetical protein
MRDPAFGASFQQCLRGLLPTDRPGLLGRSERYTLAQAHRLQWLSVLNAVGQSTPNLRDKPALIHGFPVGARGELSGTQIEIRAREFRMLTYRVPRCDRFVANDLGRRGALLEKFPRLDHPAVPVSLNFLRGELPLRISLQAFDGDGIATGTPEDHLVSNLWLSEGLGDGALDALSRSTSSRGSTRTIRTTRRR